MGLFIIFASAECNLLASMAYDHYTATCHPLLSHITMSRVCCLLMIAGCYFGGLVNMVSLTTSITQLSFCQPCVLPHFFGGFTLITSIVVILVAYMSVLMTILGIPSASGKEKAFSMCDSHMTAVDLYYGTTICI
ncbi:unnamed protein product [Gulo gulo]|uniref:Olfactory receptor n=1 Tax=Gulo gulo TaxID=48420 RepID=A0A9X9Q9R0_GULGU|nr:unnamed protein product [Gulo gulo]